MKKAQTKNGVKIVTRDGLGLLLHIIGGDRVLAVEGHMIGAGVDEYKLGMENIVKGLAVEGLEVDVRKGKDIEELLRMDKGITVAGLKGKYDATVYFTGCGCCFGDYKQYTQLADIVGNDKTVIAVGGAIEYIETINDRLNKEKHKGYLKFACFTGNGWQK